MEIIFIAGILLTAFFSIISSSERMEEFGRETQAYSFSEAILSSPCLTVTSSDGYAVKGLFDAAKLKDIYGEWLDCKDEDPCPCNSYPVCINYFYPVASTERTVQINQETGERYPTKKYKNYYFEIKSTNTIGEYCSENDLVSFCFGHDRCSDQLDIVDIKDEDGSDKKELPCALLDDTTGDVHPCKLTVWVQK